MHVRVVVIRAFPPPPRPPKPHSRTPRSLYSTQTPIFCRLSLMSYYIHVKQSYWRMRCGRTAQWMSTTLRRIAPFMTHQPHSLPIPLLLLLQRTRVLVMRTTTILVWMLGCCRRQHSMPQITPAHLLLLCRITSIRAVSCGRHTRREGCGVSGMSTLQKMLLLVVVVQKAQTRVLHCKVLRNTHLLPPLSGSISCVGIFITEQIRAHHLRKRKRTEEATRRRPRRRRPPRRRPLLLLQIRRRVTVERAGWGGRGRRK